jgi:hypothetical protein
MPDSVRATVHKDPAASTQMYLRVAEIHSDTVVLKNGGIRAVIEVGSVNVNLKSEEEQTALARGYQNFLNSLEFPIQIVVRSKKLDISGYLDKLKEVGKKQTNELLKNQVVEYGEYVKRLVEFADIMDKQFYIVIPYDTYRARNVTLFQSFWNYIHPGDSISAFEKRQKEFTQVSKDLNQRVEAVMGGLENCGLQARKLKTPELIKLFYGIYNPLTSRNEKVADLEKLDLMDSQQAARSATM